MFRRAADQRSVRAYAEVTVRVYSSDGRDRSESLFALMKTNLRSADALAVEQAGTGHHVCTASLPGTDWPGAERVEQKLADLLSQVQWVRRTE
ncbi:MAG: hypothetical protein HYV63_10855 [Candidatus Schekmanbacteria bacterium]|nr:hypothetical protein [Candidatus Schekmanbacteria bacterium]